MLDRSVLINNELRDEEQHPMRQVNVDIDNADGDNEPPSNYRVPSAGETKIDRPLPTPLSPRNPSPPDFGGRKDTIKASVFGCGAGNGTGTPSIASLRRKLMLDIHGNATWGGGHDLLDERDRRSPSQVHPGDAIAKESILFKMKNRRFSSIDEEALLSSSSLIQALRVDRDELEDKEEIEDEEEEADEGDLNSLAASRRTSNGFPVAAMRRRCSNSEKPGCTVFLDLVGYSKSSDLRQREVANDFMKTLRSILQRAWGQPPDRVRDVDKFLVLPTGDGAAICVLSAAPGHPSEEFSALWIGANLLGWAKRRGGGIGLRCGINSGLLDKVYDPYGQPNVCGDAINMAARIMDCAREGQILASTFSVIPRLRRCGVHDGEKGPGAGGEIAGMRYRICPTPNEIIVKHAVTTMVQSITCSLSPDEVRASWDYDRDGDADASANANSNERESGSVGGGEHNGRVEIGVPRKPLTKWYLKVKPTELEHDADTGTKSKVPPRELLRRHHSIAFVGVTHDQLGRVFSTVLADAPNHRWERVYIIFLDDPALTSLAKKNSKIVDGAEGLKEKKRRARIQLEIQLAPRVSDLRFFEYDRPYHCASYWDWDEPGGFIHISPLVWGADPKVCPAMDYHWNSMLPGDEYKVYRNGLTSLLMMSTPYLVDTSIDGIVKTKRSSKKWLRRRSGLF